MPDLTSRPLHVGMGWFPDQLGGLNRYLRALFEAQADAAVRPRVVVLGPASSAPPGVTVVRDATGGLLRRLYRIDRAVASALPGVDVVDLHFALYAFLPLLRGRFRRVPIVVHFQGPWAEESARAGAPRLVVEIKRRVERFVYRRADVVITLSEAFADLAAGYGVPRDRLRTLAPAVDVGRFSPGDRSEARQALDVPDSAFVVVTTRRLERRMGIDVLLSAWATVQTDHPDALLLVAGEGSERAALERQAEGAGLRSVRFVGAVDDATLVHLYRAADCSVVPSVALEGFGLVVLESLACGTPALVSDVGGLAGAVDPFDPTCVFPASDRPALAARLLRAASGELPDRAAAAAFARRRRWEDVAAEHEAVYREAAWPPLRVVFLDHTAKLSGGELALSRLLPALHRVRSTVILGEEGPIVKRIEDGGAHVEILPFGGRGRELRRDQVTARLPVASALSTTAYVLRLAIRLRRLRPDLVHTNSLKAAIYGGAAARLAGVPVVWHVRDRIAPDYLPMTAVRLVRFLARFVPAAVIANSASTMETLGLSSRGLQRSIPSPVVHDAAALFLRDTKRKTEGALRVGMLGRLADWKGQDLFLRAFARAFPDGRAEAVVIGSALFGEEEYAASLHRLVADLGIEDRVSFRGFREDIGGELARLDVLVHASKVPEPFGQVIVEGMAAGVPVIAADTGGPSEIITHGADGILYRMGSEEELAEAMARLGAEPEERRRLGERAQRRSADFSPARVAAQVLEVYDEVLGRTHVDDGTDRS